MSDSHEIVDLVSSDEENEQPVVVSRVTSTTSTQATSLLATSPTASRPQAPISVKRPSLSIQDEQVQAYVLAYTNRRDQLAREYAKKHCTHLMGDDSSAAAAATDIVNGIFDLQLGQIENTPSTRKLPRRDYQRHHQRILREDSGDITVEAILTRRSAVQAPLTHDFPPPTPGPEPEPKGKYPAISCNISKQHYDEISRTVTQNFLSTKRIRHEMCTLDCARFSCPPTQAQIRGVPSFLLPLSQGFQRQFVNHSGDKKTYFYVAPCGRKLRNMHEVYRYLDMCASDLDVDVFTFDEVRIFLPKSAFKQVPCNYYLKDLSYGREAQPIPVINSVDDWDSLNKENYEYRKERIIDHKTLQTLPPGQEFVSCCSCNDNCQSSSCECKQLTRFHMFSEDEDETSCYQHKRLKPLQATAVFECNRKCPCNPRCPNRVVQNGIKVQMEIFKTAFKGWGVRAKQDIPAGTFICTYSAEVLSGIACDSRADDKYLAELDFIECAQIAKGQDYEDAPTVEVVDNSDGEDITDTTAPIGVTSERDDGYRSHSRVNRELMHSPFHRYRGASRPQRAAKVKAEDRIKQLSVINRPPSSPNRVDRNLVSLRLHFPDQSPFVLDAQVKGNVGRFLNHSCDPNCFVQSVFIETHDPRLPHVCVFSKKDIKFNEELTWSYEYKIGSVPGRVLDCYCGSNNCSGRLL